MVQQCLQPAPEVCPVLSSTSLLTLPTAPVKSYLIAYNVLSALSWAYVLSSLLVHLCNLDRKSDAYRLAKNSASTALSRWLSHIPFLNFSAERLEHQLPALLRPFYQRAETAYLRVGTETAFVQTFAILEVLHVTLGWVRSPLPTTLAQVTSRLFLVWGITEQFVEACIPAILNAIFSFIYYRRVHIHSTRRWFSLGPWSKSSATVSMLSILLDLIPTSCSG